ncbi:hypothetical protein [Actinoplanes sp. L3-i22]|uniref:hypothetical protein n=1 Tax=Actinoplanes sp. L3-i22 TaxID=2836373 RepID=UPI001C7619D1|nr:hypothetical protein [Actinoplanes sp. L3-i22]BCY12756.1 hypothetical protein L3i22_078440 [Actinoplanes sp. L3-i22]
MIWRPLPLVALALLAGCTGSGDRSAPAASPSASACAGGQTTFGTAIKGTLLTGVTPVDEMVVKNVQLAVEYEEINTRTAELRTTARVPAEQIYRELAATYADSRPLVDYGTVHHPATGESFSVDGTGRFVNYEWIRTVDTPFHYTCGGTTADGTVVSWEAAGTSGMLDCDEPDQGPSDAADEPERKAREMRC